MQGSSGNGDASGGQLIWYADLAYGTGDLRAAIAAAAYQAVIKPWPALPAADGLPPMTSPLIRPPGR